MIDHLTIHVSDFDKMADYYEKVLATVGYHRGASFPGSLQLVDDASGDNVWVSAAEEGTAPSPTHIAWHAADTEQVKAFYDAALAAGGTDNGAPGPRDYHPGYYACFVHDPEGNNIEAVLHDYQA